MGEIQYGPISRAVLGYWPGVEKIGYRHRPDEAARLLAEAGYGPDRPLPITLVASPEYTKVAEVLREQLAAVGVDVTIEPVEPAGALQQLADCRFQLALVRILYPDADILVLLYHSTKGSLPIARSPTRSSTGCWTAPGPRWTRCSGRCSLTRRRNASWSRPTCCRSTPRRFTAVRTRVAGAVLADNGELLLYDARLVE
ncbi:MAG: ABC transporter substrate-binding protein [Actinomycetota bacterium]|nr:ABC transporter substrate-binding protein [Actinomycetota bacterium]